MSPLLKPFTLYVVCLIDHQNPVCFYRYLVSESSEWVPSVVSDPPLGLSLRCYEYNIFLVSYKPTIIFHC